MTYESPEWYPGDPDWATQEASTMDSRGQVHDLDEVIAGGQRFINPVSTSEQSADFTADFHGTLQARVNVLRVKVRNSCHTIGNKLLADKWMVVPLFGVTNWNDKKTERWAEP
jgi:hypothetical protein